MKIKQYVFSTVFELSLILNSLICSPKFCVVIFDCDFLRQSVCSQVVLGSPKARQCRSEMAAGFPMRSGPKLGSLITENSFYYYHSKVIEGNSRKEFDPAFLYFSPYHSVFSQ